MVSIQKQIEFLAQKDLPIGHAIRARRKSLGLTLEEVAKRSGLSPAFISLAERGKASPSIVSLLSLAKALEVTLDYFMEIPRGHQLVRKAAEPEYIDWDSPVKYIRLSAGLHNQKLEVILLEIPPKADNERAVFPKVSRESGEAVYYMLDGQLTFQLDDEVFVLQAGDSVHFNTGTQYWMSNDGDKMARILWVGTPVLFEEENNNQPE